MTTTMQHASVSGPPLPPLGHLQSAAEWADWAAQPFVLDDDGWRVYLDTSLGRWDVHVDQQRRRTFLNPALWEALEAHPVAMEAFIAEHLHVTTGGPRFVTVETGPYRDAAVVLARRQGVDSPVPKDRLQDLGERVQSLLVQAVSLNEKPTPGQQALFTERYAELLGVCEALETELRHTRSNLNLATVAMRDPAATPRKPDLLPAGPDLNGWMAAGWRFRAGFARRKREFCEHRLDALRSCARRS
jgi:hypothetical protein